MIKAAKILYNIFWWPTRATFRFFLDFEVEAEEDIENLKGPLIIASNHLCWFDAFLIGAAFPFNSKIFPIHYACWYRYYYLFLPLTRAFGAFPIRKGVGLENALKKAIEILEKGGTIGIFPEGKRRHLGRPRKARRGVVFLSLKTNSPILPVLIEGILNLKISEFFLRKRRVKVKIGKKIYLSSRKEEETKLCRLAEFVMSKIRQLAQK
jgi:1-acyl-sn-glycerol-3-phosphate acyltransferase